MSDGDVALARFSISKWTTGDASDGSLCAYDVENDKIRGEDKMTLVIFIYLFIYYAPKTCSHG